MSDKHVRRTGRDYAGALAQLLPTGLAWPRDPDSVIMAVVRSLANVWGTVDSRAADLLEYEADPRLTNELLGDWERNWGLPDPCFGEVLTLPDRHNMLLRIMTMKGAQSRAFFLEVSRWLGYNITITEYAPFMCGVSECGITAGDDGQPRWFIGGEDMRFYWTVHVRDASLQWFRAGESEAGVDPMLRIGLATDLECLLRRWKPAHTEVVFDYSNLETGDPLAGTP